MNLERPDRTRRPAVALAPVALLATALSLAAFGAGCAPKITSVNSSYTMPEGTVSPKSIMMIWPDAPTTAYYYTDLGPTDPDPTDHLDRVETPRRYPPGTIQGMVFDQTNADRFQIFRREANGGVRQFANVTAQRTRQDLISQFDVFHWFDTAPSSYSPPTYIGRGLINDVANQSSPLTNPVQLAPRNLFNMNLAAVWWSNTDPTKGPAFPIPRIKLHWTPVPGAAFYLLHVYDFRSDIRGLDERILSGTPTPFYDGQATDYLLASVAPTVSLLFVNMGILGVNKPNVMVRISAIDSQGQLIGISAGHDDPLQAFVGNPTAPGTTYGSEVGIQRGVDGAGTYVLYRLNATTAVDTVPAGGGGGGGTGG